MIPDLPEVNVKKGAALPLGPIIGGAASLFGGVISNQQNKAAAHRQMEFQKYMSNTAYQRGVADMRKAGLNPYLAYGNGGASTPGGGTYTANDVMGPAVASAQAARMTDQQLKLLREQTAETHGSALKAGWDAQTAEVGFHSAQALKENIGYEGEAIKARAALDRANADAIRLTLPGLRNEAGFQNQVGLLGPWLSRLGSAAQLGSQLLPGTAGMLSRGANAGKLLKGYQRY